MEECLQCGSEKNEEFGIEGLGEECVVSERGEGEE